MVVMYLLRYQEILILCEYIIIIIFFLLVY